MNLSGDWIQIRDMLGEGAIAFLIGLTIGIALVVICG